MSPAGSKSEWEYRHCLSAHAHDLTHSNTCSITHMHSDESVANLAKCMEQDSPTNSFNPILDKEAGYVGNVRCVCVRAHPDIQQLWALAHV